MGGGASVAGGVTSLSPEQVAELVGSIGDKYKPYMGAIIENGFSGDVLGDADASSLDDFLDCMGVESKAHRSVLKTKFKGLKGGGSNDPTNLSSSKIEAKPAAGASVIVEHDFVLQNAISQSPRQIMSELLLIQGVPLDPADVETTVNKIREAIGSGEGDGVQSFDCFISYRVAADADLAEKLYLYLKSYNINAFLDKKCLKNGENWKDGFLSGLKRSKCFVALVSKKALNIVRDETVDHSTDNVLLEYETALLIKRKSKNKNFICPILVGEYTLIPQLQQSVLVKFADFNPTLYPDSISGGPPAPPPAEAKAKGKPSASPAKTATAAAAAPAAAVPAPAAAAPAAGPETVSTTQLGGTVSRFNGAYYCEISCVSLIASTNTLTLTFNLRGDGSIGPLKSPTETRLKVGSNSHAASSHKILTSDKFQITGFLNYVVNVADVKSKKVEFQYAPEGYSMVVLLVPLSTAKIENCIPTSRTGEPMFVSDYAGPGYSTGWICSYCRVHKKGERWFNNKTEDDYCFSCVAAPSLLPKCGKGHIMDRYAPCSMPEQYKRRFKNPSIYCSGCKKKAIHLGEVTLN